MSTGYHEQNLSAATRTVHRALASLMEELEAADWYSQRMDVNDDDQLNAILQHNRDEEIEHAAMLLEWLRRRVPVFDEHLRRILFTSGDIAVEEAEETDGAQSVEQGPVSDNDDSASSPKNLGLSDLSNYRQQKGK